MSYSLIQAAEGSHCCGIVPPYMLTKIAENDPDGAIRQVAINTLQKHSAVRSARYQIQKDLHERHIVPIHDANSAIKIYDANYRTRLPGTLISEPALSKDREVVEVYKWAQKTDEFFQKLFDRHSIDDRGMDAISTVHFDRNYVNAFWNGEQMVYGDGDGRYFDSFTRDSDIYAHEYTHGVTQFDNNLRYRNQAGALNESLSDAFGVMAKQYIQDETVDKSNWLIGESLLIGDQYALRSLKSPGTAYVNHPVFGTDPQPATMDAYVSTSSDNGGVHINSGILNHAFYLTAKKLKDYDHEQYDYSWKGAGRIWYDARLRVGSSATFSEFANKTVEVAQEIFGRDSYAEKACRYAWGDVKVEVKASEPAPSGGWWCCVI